MEIDFLGLLHPSKSQYSTTNIPPMSMSMDHPSITHKDCLFSAMESSSGVETSLSLATTSFGSNTNILNFSKQKKEKEKQKQKKSLGFLYDLNDSPGCRDDCEMILSETTPVNLEFHTNAYTDVLPERGHNSMHGISEESSSACMIGYRPTVAMARRATLARFLEKRLHRLNQARASHLIKGKSTR